MAIKTGKALFQPHHSKHHTYQRGQFPLSESTASHPPATVTPAQSTAVRGEAEGGTEPTFPCPASVKEAQAAAHRKGMAEPGPAAALDGAGGAGGGCVGEAGPSAALDKKVATTREEEWLGTTRSGHVGGVYVCWTVWTPAGHINERACCHFLESDNK